MKMKDVVFIALLTAVYMIIYALSMLLISLLGQFGHAISPGICALLSGAVIIFMNRKVGKMWEYTFFTLLVMGAFALMGGGYLPWVITSAVTAVIADLIASRSNDTSIPKLAAASGIMHVGQAWGAIVPSTFFLDSYREHWIKRGMSPEDMDAGIRFTKGLMGALSSVVVFILAFVGVFLGYLILKGHLEKMKK